MTVKELKKMLNKYPDDMEVIIGGIDGYYTIVSEDYSGIRVGIPDGYGWVEDPDLGNENKHERKQYLYLSGI